MKADRTGSKHDRSGLKPMQNNGAGSAVAAAVSTMDENGAKAPAHLSKASREWWQAIADEFVLERHHLTILTRAAEALDRISEAQKAIARDGSYSTNRHGEVKGHPGLSVMNAASILVARLIRELDLDVEVPTKPYVTPLERRKPPPLLPRYR